MAWERWTDAEWHKAKDLLTRNSTQAVAVMVGRGVGSLKEKIRWEGMTQDARDRRHAQINARRAAFRAANPRPKKRKSERDKHKSPRIIEYVSGGARPGPELEAERARRNAIEHRDLTAAFFGDPKPGFSALDQRQ